MGRGIANRKAYLIIEMVNAFPVASMPLRPYARHRPAVGVRRRILQSRELHRLAESHQLDPNRSRPAMITNRSDLEPKRSWSKSITGA